MKILTKRQAEKAILESLFAPGSTLACLPKERFDMGKYEPGIAGKELPPQANPPRLVWAERRRDKWGAFDILFCIPAEVSR